MRIGFFTDTYLPTVNGVTYVIEILRKDLESAGHEVWIFAPEDYKWHLPKDDKIIRYKAIGGVFYRDQFNSLFWSPHQIKRVEGLNLDVLVTFTPTFIGSFSVYCSVRLGIPLVLHYGTDIEEYAELYKPTTIGGIFGSAILMPLAQKMSAKETWRLYRGYFGPKPKNTSYYRYVTRHILSTFHQKATAIITPSDKMAGKLEQWPITQAITVIPTGVDPLPSDNDFQRYFAKKHGLKGDDEIILYAGRLSIEKNLDLLVDAFEILADRPDTKLLLVGDFQYRHNLEARVKDSRYKDRIIFAGQIKRQQLGAIYGLADIFAFPSLTDCQALVLNEAALAGLPLVWCDDESLNPVLINKKTGLKAHNEAEDFAKKLTQLLDDPNLTKTYGLNAQKEAKKFSEKNQTKKLADFLEGLV